MSSTLLDRPPVSDDLICAVLDRIHDPCSVAAGQPKGLVAMGLVLGWDWPAPGTLRVRFCITFPGCTLAPHFTEAARNDLLAIPGVAAVEAVVDTGFLWTPGRMA